MNLVNGIESDVIDVADRGLAYGDGVFRTFMLRAGRALLWQRQYAKLASDCKALGIVCPPQSALDADLSAIAARVPDSVVKIIVTRGSSERGYSSDGSVRPRRIVRAVLPPSYPPQHYNAGVRARLCHTRLALQPALAGVKHLNRLENVLARAEWNDAGIAEGIMLDMDGNVTCGTMSNLFLVRDGELLTPDLSRCGVAGVTRQLVLESARLNGATVTVTRIRPDDVYAAEELFLVNSVFGAWQVAALEGRGWRPGTVTGRVRRWISDAQRD